MSSSSQPNANSLKLPANSSELPASGSQLIANSSKLVIGQGRADDVVAFEEQMVDFFVSAADLLGVPKSVAAIYGLVFASPVPLSFAEIESRLDISKGSISQGLRVLREVGALKTASSSELIATSSKLKATSSELPATSSKLPANSLYEPDLELRKLVLRFLDNRLQKQLDVGKSRLVELRRSIPAGRNGDAAVIRHRLKSLDDWQSKASRLLPLAKTFLKLGG